MKELTKIANIYGTDKGSIHSEGHNYTEFYNDIFDEYRQRALKENRKLNILEIGIQYGYSIHMLNDFFKDTANIYAIDIDLNQNKYHNDNIALYQLDATNKDNINEFLNQIGNIQFDIIIDDASHLTEHQIYTLLYLYKSVKSNGIYIIEDLHTSLMWGDKLNSMLYYLSFDEKLPFMTNEEHNELHKHIKTAIIYNHYNIKSNFRGHSITSILTFK